MRVMVVEGDEVDRRACEGLLQREGHRVCWAATLEGARRHLRLEEVDLVLLDVELDGEACGLELLPRVPRGTVVFVVSARPEQRVRELASRYLLDPSTRYFPKPLDAGRLVEEVARVARGLFDFDPDSRVLSLGTRADAY